MKKISSILLSLIYFILTTGFVVNLHYCQNRLKSVSFIGNAEKCCCQSAKMSSNCCKNRQLLVQMDKNDQIVSNPPEIGHSYSMIMVSVFCFIECKNDIPYNELFNYDLPPPKVDIWKTNCSFLFYG